MPSTSPSLGGERTPWLAGGAWGDAAGQHFQRDLSAPVEERSFVVGSSGRGERLDVFLASRLPWKSRSAVQRLICDGRVEVVSAGDRPVAAGAVRPSMRTKRGQRVRVALDAAFIEAGTGPAPPPPVVYEDDWLLAVSKPPSVSLYPTRRHRAGSLVESVHRAQRLAGTPPASPCHRLDRETSGLVLFARDRETRAALGRQFEERTIVKSYLALVTGEIRGESGLIEAALGPDPDSRVDIKMSVRRDGRGKPARTRWRVVARLAGCTLLELSPLTGRQHQLRAHLAARGHPVLGDKLYLGGDALFLASCERPLLAEERRLLGCDRQALHAWRLTLRHPATGAWLRLEAPPWPDLARMLGQAARRDIAGAAVRGYDLPL